MSTDVATTANSFEFRIGDQVIDLGKRSVFVGILNVTPDSFSDGGEFCSVSTACERALQMYNQGADIVDIGGESTRPGFEEVSLEDEIVRVVPVVESILRLRPQSVLSVDTSKPEVASAALKAGCMVVNDIWGFQKSNAMAEVVADSTASAILMRNGRDESRKGTVIDRILRSWEKSLKISQKAGIESHRIILDPGIGFGTTRREDLEILRNLRSLVAFGYPVMLGASRKRITAEPLGVPLEHRLESTLATTSVGIESGVQVFRVHDVEENRRFADMADLIYRKGELDG